MSMAAARGGAPAIPSDGMARQERLRHLRTLAELYGMDRAIVKRRRSSGACMVARLHERNDGTAVFHFDEADIGLRLLP